MTRRSQASESGCAEVEKGNDIKNKTETVSVHVMQLWPLASEGLAWGAMEGRERQRQRQRQREAREGVRKRIPLRRKLHILRVLTNSNSVKRTSIAKSTILRLYKLKLALETVKRHYENLLATRREHINLLNYVKEKKDVKIEKVRAGTFMVKVTCEKGGNKLVAILEAFDEMCLNVEQAKVSCENGFSLEAIALAEDQTLDVRDVSEALLKAIGKLSGEKDSQKFDKSCDL
ncbi:unnamed protein product [Sphenostylis stenocarpa]|uniref:Plant bHLH transcription factor ACT-like domain-containing protein n=1 Tax=Sphenostylis stenocarpa TaxID=92480 RepID=A0AA86SG39_9FABA|nr:unnamed protein product [Sphenostylis stenocarpa]